MTTYTVNFIYHSGAMITKRKVPADAVDRIIEIQERENKWARLIISPSKV